MQYLLPVILVLLAVVGLSLRLLLKPDDKRKGPGLDVGESAAMRERGIHCTRSQHREAQRRQVLYRRRNKREEIINKK